MGASEPVKRHAQDSAGSPAPACCSTVTPRPTTRARRGGAAAGGCYTVRPDRLSADLPDAAWLGKACLEDGCRGLPSPSRARPDLRRRDLGERQAVVTRLAAALPGRA